MRNPLKWQRVDQARLFFAVAFGALLGFTSGSGPLGRFASGSGDVWFNLLCALIGAVLVGGWFYYYRASR
jgi:hypothetical protein